MPSPRVPAQATAYSKALIRVLRDTPFWIQLAVKKCGVLSMQVWAVLTDYERLPEFVPNLESCVQEPSRTGRKRLRQRGCSQSLFWRLEAEAVLEVEEAQTGGGQREIRFQLVEGDFKVHLLLSYELPVMNYPSALLHSAMGSPHGEWQGT